MDKFPIYSFLLLVTSNYLHFLTFSLLLVLSYLFYVSTQFEPTTIHSHIHSLIGHFGYKQQFAQPPLIFPTTAPDFYFYFIFGVTSWSTVHQLGVPDSSFHALSTLSFVLEGKLETSEGKTTALRKSVGQWHFYWWCGIWRNSPWVRVGSVGWWSTSLLSQLSIPTKTLLFVIQSSGRSFSFFSVPSHVLSTRSLSILSSFIHLCVAALSSLSLSFNLLMHQALISSFECSCEPMYTLSILNIYISIINSDTRNL